MGKEVLRDFHVLEIVADVFAEKNHVLVLVVLEAGFQRSSHFLIGGKDEFQGNFLEIQELSFCVTGEDEPRDKVQVKVDVLKEKVKGLQTAFDHVLAEGVLHRSFLFRLVKESVVGVVTGRAEKPLLGLNQKVMHFLYVELDSVLDLHDCEGLDSSRDFLAVGDSVLGEGLENILGKNLNSYQLIEQLLVNSFSFLELPDKTLLVSRLSPGFVNLKLVAVLATAENDTGTHLQVGYLRTSLSRHSEGLNQILLANCFS